MTRVVNFVILSHCNRTEALQKPRPNAAAPLCELQGPRTGAAAQLRPAAAGILTLTSGELRVTGCLGGMYFGIVRLFTGGEEALKLGRQ